MEFLIGAIVIGWFLTKVPRVVADAIATSKAAAAGAWDVVNKDRAARDAAARRRAATRESWYERVAAAWARARQKRHEQQGGTGDYPGFRAYWRQQYRAWWEDRINHAQARRDARAPYDPNGRGWASRWYDRMRAAYRKRYGADGGSPDQSVPQTDPKPVPGQPAEPGPEAGQQQTTTEGCPGCGEPLVDEPPRWWRPREWGPPPNRSHTNREPFCGDEGVVHDSDERPPPPFLGCFSCGAPAKPGDFFCAKCLHAEAKRQQQEAAQGTTSGGGSTPTAQPEPPQTSESDCTCSGCGKTDAAVLYSTPDGGWECSDCADRRANPDSPSPADRPGPAADTTASEQDATTPTTQGEPMTQALVPVSAAPGAAEVTVNDHARANFQKMLDGAAKLAEAAAMAEAARKEIDAAANANVDGMSMKKFDGTATAAAEAVHQGVNLGTLSQWCELAGELTNAAQAGHDSLDKYRDSEDLVASEGVDGSTLDSAAA